MLWAERQEFSSPAKLKSGFFFNASVIGSYPMIVEVRWQIPEVDKISPSSTVVKNVRSCISTFPHMFTD
jgi:hypothetical protein